MYGIFSEAAVIYPLISEHLAAEQLHVGSAMSEGCHRPPSPPRAPLQPGAEPTPPINLPDGMRFASFLPPLALSTFVFMFPRQLLPKCFGVAQSTRDFFSSSSIFKGL